VQWCSAVVHPAWRDTYNASGCSCELGEAMQMLNIRGCSSMWKAAAASAPEDGSSSSTTAGRPASAIARLNLRLFLRRQRLQLQLTWDILLYCTRIILHCMWSTQSSSRPQIVHFDALHSKPAQRRWCLQGVSRQAHPPEYVCAGRSAISAGSPTRCSSSAASASTSSSATPCVI